MSASSSKTLPALHEVVTGQTNTLGDAEAVSRKAGCIMRQIFIDDGFPDAREYNNNYIFYDEKDLESMLEALERLDHSEPAKQSALAPARLLLERSIEKKKSEQQDPLLGSGKQSPIWTKFQVGMHRLLALR